MHVGNRGVRGRRRVVEQVAQATVGVDWGSSRVSVADGRARGGTGAWPTGAIDGHVDHLDVAIGPEDLVDMRLGHVLGEFFDDNLAPSAATRCCWWRWWCQRERRRHTLELWNSGLGVRLAVRPRDGLRPRESLRVRDLVRDCGV